jgi:glycosyltransferase involved in cell wall biosynthesis
MHRVETMLAQMSRLTIATTEKDATHFKTVQPNTIVIPNGVDCSYLVFNPTDKNTVLFLGSFDYAPNRESLRYFCDQIVPVLKKDGVHCIIAGSSSQHIEVPGVDETMINVPDIRDVFSQAGVLVVPLLSGGGSRIKILEAMAAGVSVVSTRKGAEGLEVVDNKHLLIAETPQEFIEKINRVLSDKKLRDALVKNARAFVEQHHDWKNSQNVLLEQIEQVTHG